MLRIFIFAYCIFFAESQKLLENASIAQSLELVHVIFRHGDRTPDSPYPNDPYRDATYYPVGFRELTNVGKVTAYNIGVALRERYDEFLGDVYTPNLIEVNTSPISRCRASVKLLLAALFPPKRDQIWNNDLLWLPIPYQYTPEAENRIFLSMSSCPNYNNLILQSERLFEESGRLDVYKQYISYLEESSGYNISISMLALLLHSTLKSEQEWGYPLPPWSDSVWPEPLSSFAALNWEMICGTPELRTILAGFLMKKVVDDTYSAIQEKFSFLDNPIFSINSTNIVEEISMLRRPRLYLYSGHDSNVAAVLSWLGVFVPHSPPYGAYIIIEIHKTFGRINQTSETYDQIQREIKIFYQDYSTSSPQQLSIPGCSPKCSFDAFVTVYEPYFRAEELCG